MLCIGFFNLIVNLPLRCAVDRNGYFDTFCGIKTVIIEYSPDRRAECLETDTTVFVVVLYVAHLRRLLNAGVCHKAVVFAAGNLEHEYTSLVALVGVVLDVVEQRL